MITIPHAPIPVEEARPSDIWFLLSAGACYEILTRTLAYMAKKKSKTEVQTEKDHWALKYETAQKRRLGPSAFVETSKLERAVLAKEKELAQMQETRKNQSEQVQRLIRNSGLMLYAMVFVVYYSIPILSIDGMRVPSDDLMTESMETSDERAASFLKAVLFPVSYVGVGLKLARFGLPNPAASFGALVVLWSAQVTMGKVIDCIELMLP